jgi:dihydrolipoamide dehydrogenase
MHPGRAAASAVRVSGKRADPASRGRVRRPWTYENDHRGTLGLLADRDRRVLVGAWAVAPLASEWIHQASLAIRARIPIDTLLDQVAQYPTYTEAYLTALEQLPL